MKKLHLLTLSLIFITNLLYSQTDSCNAKFCYLSGIDINSNLNVTFQNQSTAGYPICCYYWEFGDSGTSTLENPIHIYSGTSSFNVTLSIIDEWGCQDIFTNTVSIVSTCDSTSNITKEFANNKIDIYPSIVSTTFKVETYGLIESKLKFYLYDLFGKIILESALLDNNTEFCRNKIKNGIYFYNILNKNIVVKNGKLIFD